MLFPICVERRKSNDLQSLTKKKEWGGAKCGGVEAWDSRGGAPVEDCGETDERRV